MRYASQYALFAHAAKGASWKPSQMPNLWAGYDPTTTISSTKWSDGWSGNGNDLIVNSGSIPKNTLNGQTVPSFTGTIQNTLATAANFPQTGNSAWTIYIAFKLSSISANSGICGFGNVGASLQAAGLYGFGNGAWTVAFAGANNYHPNISLSTNFILITTIKSAGAINTTTTVRLNGVTVSSLGGDSTSTPSVVATPLYLGRWANYTGDLFGGLVGAYFITTAADSMGNVQNMESYINNLFSPTIF